MWMAGFGFKWTCSAFESSHNCCHRVRFVGCRCAKDASAARAPPHHAVGDYITPPDRLAAVWTLLAYDRVLEMLLGSLKTPGISISKRMWIVDIGLLMHRLRWSAYFDSANGGGAGSRWPVHRQLAMLPAAVSDQLTLLCHYSHHTCE